MPTNRLVLATPISDGTNDFPFVDVRLWALSGLVDPASLVTALDPTMASLDNGFFNFQVDLTLALSFYRLVSGRRVLLADSRFTPQFRYFTIPKRMRVSGIIVNVFNFYRPIYQAAGGLNSLTPDMLRFSFESENTFEAISAGGSFKIIDFLPPILQQECGQDFAGVAVVEDEE